MNWGGNILQVALVLPTVVCKNGAGAGKRGGNGAGGKGDAARDARADRRADLSLQVGRLLGRRRLEAVTEASPHDSH
jgi:hypothetical protein